MGFFGPSALATEWGNPICCMARCARTILGKYGRTGRCTAACETTANMWITTVDAFECAGMQSGKEARLGRIKKMGADSLVNWTMCEAACRRHAGKHMLAIIVVAHKMVAIMWHMLKTRTPYESRSEDLYNRKLARMQKKHRDKD